jgi:hypothetical protein
MCPAIQIFRAVAFCAAFVAPLVMSVVSASAQCGSRSPLACSAVPVALPFQLGWSANEGGIGDGSAVGTGFTVVEPHTSNFDPAVPSVPAFNGYEPSMLQVNTGGSGTLKITTSRGIQYRDPAFSANTNSLVNGLGVGVNISTVAVRVETLLTDLPSATNLAEQGAIWAWLNEDNLVKLAAINTGTVNYKFQLQVEDYPPTATGFPATSGAPLEINTASFNMTGKTAKLILILDPTPTPSFTAYYDIGAGEVLIGSFPQAANAAGATSTCSGGVCPTPGVEFFTGVDHDGSGATPNVTFVGLYATQRNNTTVAPRLVYTFDSFSVKSYCTTNPDCDDGNACNGVESCSANTCVPGVPLVCNDGNVCTNDTCNPASGCQFPANTDPCDDGSACTTGDTCSGGVCQPGAPVVCNDSNVCTTDICNAGVGCQFIPNALSCDDGSLCTTGDTCSAGSCVGTPVVCNDSNVCTTDTCNALTGCAFTNNTAPCSDGDACTENDTCAGGLCVPGTAVVCNDANACTTDTCDSVNGCEYTNNTEACDDGNVCTMGDICSGGSCQPGLVNTCPAGCDPGPPNTMTLSTQTKTGKVQYKGGNTGKLKTKGAFLSSENLPITTSDVTIAITDSVGTYYEATIPANSFVQKGAGFKFQDKLFVNNGLQKAGLKKKSDGSYQYQFSSRNLDLSSVGGLPTGTGVLAVRIGGQCWIDNSHTCTASASGTSAKCQ